MIDSILLFIVEPTTFNSNNLARASGAINTIITYALWEVSLQHLN